MQNFRLTSLALAVAAIAVVACRKQPVVASTPANPSADSIARARQDSIARAEAARRDSIDRANAAREAARRDSIAAAERARADARATLTTPVHFDYDQDAIRDDARQQLDAKLAILQANPSIRLRIAGHTDARGSDEYNMALGLRRANAARRYLVDRGVDASRLETVSFGEEQPVATGDTEDAYAQNRRDEFAITAGDVTRTQ